MIEFLKSIMTKTPLGLHGVFKGCSDKKVRGEGLIN
jgi:hypothetical protein